VGSTDEMDQPWIEIDLQIHPNVSGHVCSFSDLGRRWRVNLFLDRPLASGAVSSGASPSTGSPSS
jgi:hypothetical protein